MGGQRANTFGGLTSRFQRERALAIPENENNWQTSFEVYLMAQCAWSRRYRRCLTSA